MSFIHEAVPFHQGEDEMHRLLHVPNRDNPSSPFLTPNGANLLMRCPLLALGTIDSKGRPWTTLIGGEAGFSRPIAQSIIGIKTLVDRNHDPVISWLLDTDADGEPVSIEGNGKMVSGLAIDLENRKRVKLFGRMMGGAVAATTDGVGEAQVVVRIEQSLGNCPKYLNKKKIIPRIPEPKLVSEALPLFSQALKLLASADIFFISSSNSGMDMDTNIRGGPRGFVRVLENGDDVCTLVYPEYSGNRLYQTLGNLRNTPQAGLVFPDFETGDVLYLTGTTEILVGAEANAILSRSNLAVKIQVSAAKYVSKGLAFVGEPGAFSPYNPPVRYLSAEISDSSASTQEIGLQLIDRQILTPSIARFRFRLADPSQDIRWKPGQYVMISLEKELNIGYSHMRDDDPTSLNDDFLRTFTVSNRPNTNDKTREFEITIRNVGVVTSKLFRHNLRAELDVSLKGFGGSFIFKQLPGERICFIAGGIGITPLLAQAQDLDLKNMMLFWSVTYGDIGLVTDTFERIPGLSESTRIFVTGKPSVSRPDADISRNFEKLGKFGGVVEKRRLNVNDLLKYRDQNGGVSKWYTCTSNKLRLDLLAWLNGETVLYEDFNY